jgi:hypothetical protein
VFDHVELLKGRAPADEWCNNTLCIEFVVQRQVACWLLLPVPWKKLVLLVYMEATHTRFSGLLTGMLC